MENTKKDFAYRRAEAMYHKGYGTNEIAKAIGLTKMDTLDILQKIFHLEEIKKKYQQNGPA